MIKTKLWLKVKMLFNWRTAFHRLWPGESTELWRFDKAATTQSFSTPSPLLSTSQLLSVVNFLLKIRLWQGVCLVNWELGQQNQTYNSKLNFHAFQNT